MRYDLLLRTANLALPEQVWLYIAGSSELDVVASEDSRRAAPLQLSPRVVAQKTVLRPRYRDLGPSLPASERALLIDIAPERPDGLEEIGDHRSRIPSSRRMYHRWAALRLGHVVRERHCPLVLVHVVRILNSLGRHVTQKLVRRREAVAVLAGELGGAAVLAGLAADADGVDRRQRAEFQARAADVDRLGSAGGNEGLIPLPVRSFAP